MQEHQDSKDVDTVAYDAVCICNRSYERGTWSNEPAQAVGFYLSGAHLAIMFRRLGLRLAFTVHGKHTVRLRVEEAFMCRLAWALAMVRARVKLSVHEGSYVNAVWLVSRDINLLNRAASPVEYKSRTHESADKK